MPTISLAYHDVVPRGAFESSGFSSADPAGDPQHLYKFEIQDFEAHLDAIDVTCGHLLRQRQTALTLNGAREAVFLHFDDGGKSATTVGQLLAVRGWRGHFWITTDRIGNSGFVSADDILGLIDQGHVVGSHSCSHPLLMGQLSDAELDREWRESLEALSEISQRRICVASVPGGDCPERVVAAAARSGVQLLFNSEPTMVMSQRAGCTILGRYSIKRSTSPREAAAIASGARRPRYRQWALWNAKKLAKRAGGSYWLALRRQLLRPGS